MTSDDRARYEFDTNRIVGAITIGFIVKLDLVEVASRI